MFEILMHNYFYSIFKTEWIYFNKNNLNYRLLYQKDYYNILIKSLQYNIILIDMIL